MATIQTFDYSVDLLSAILWEYNTATSLQALLQAKQDWYNTNQQEFWENWETNVFDLRTCNDFGCSVWAIILGIPVTLVTGTVPNPGTPFGFDATNLSNFSGAYNFASTSAEPIDFTTAEKRLILQLRYRQLVARGTIPEVNKILADLIVPTYGKCYMLDGLNMSQRLITLFSVNSALAIILTEYDLIPRPAAVKMAVIDTTIPVFGFGPTNQNFGNGGFCPYDLSV